MDDIGLLPKCGKNVVAVVALRYSKSFVTDFAFVKSFKVLPGKSVEGDGNIDVVFNFFVADLHISETSENKIIFTADVQVSKPFIAWCCSFGTGVNVTVP